MRTWRDALLRLEIAVLSKVGPDSGRGALIEPQTDQQTTAPLRDFPQPAEAQPEALTARSAPRRRRCPPAAEGRRRAPPRRPRREVDPPQEGPSPSSSPPRRRRSPRTGQQQLVPGQARLTRVERRPLGDELADPLECAVLQRHDHDRPARGTETQVGESLDELLDDRCAKAGVGDDRWPVGALDDERRAAVEAIGAAAADPEPSQLLVAEAALDRRPGCAARRRPSRSSARRAERQPADERLPVRLPPLDRIRRHSDRTLSLARPPEIRGGHVCRCGKSDVRACRAPRPWRCRCARR